MRKYAHARARRFRIIDFADDLEQAGWEEFYRRPEGTETQRLQNAWDAMLYEAWRWKYGINYNPHRTHHPNVTKIHIPLDSRPLTSPDNPEHTVINRDAIAKISHRLQETPSSAQDHAVWTTLLLDYPLQRTVTPGVRKQYAYRSKRRLQNVAQELQVE